MTNFIEVFLFTQSKNSILREHLLQLILGVVVLSIGLFFFWKYRRERGTAAEGFKAAFLIFWGLFWGTTSGLSFNAQTKSYSELMHIYETKLYSIAEGDVQVLHQQSRTGHDQGDIIVVDGIEFEFSYFSESFGYHKTISHSGVLKQGAVARLSYCERPAVNGSEGTDNVILRVELLETP